MLIFKAQAALTGCESVPDDYTPYGQWTDLPATRDGLQEFVPITHWSQYADPWVFNETTAATDIAIILMHGRNGSPWSSNLTTLAEGLSALGYKVIAPTTPWAASLITP